MSRLRDALQEVAAALAAKGMMLVGEIQPATDTYRANAFTEPALAALASDLGGVVVVTTAAGYAFPRLQLALLGLTVRALASMRKPTLAELRAELEHVSAELDAETRKASGGQAP